MKKKRKRKKYVVPTKPNDYIVIGDYAPDRSWKGLKFISSNVITQTVK